MKSKTKIKEQIKKKNNLEMIETIQFALKNPEWKGVANILSGPRRKQVGLNLNQIESQVKDKDIVVVPGKVLSQGEITKKVRIVALHFSGTAKEKLEKNNVQIDTIINEIKQNPKAKNVKILNGEKTQ